MQSHILIFLTIFCLASASAQAADSDVKYYQKAFTAISSNNALEAENLASKGHDPILNKVVTGYAMGLPNNDYSFEQLNSFITENPGWPGLKGIQMIAEQKIPTNGAPTKVATWFTAHPPVTLVGFYHYIDALNQSGLASIAQSAIHDRWIEGSFTGDEQVSFYSHFSELLDNAAMADRVDHLLWKNSEAEAERMLPYLSATDKSVAEARIALATLDRNPEVWLARVPVSEKNNPGLLYQRLRWAIKNNENDEAYDMLLHAPAELGNAEAWWDQRQVMVRRAIEMHDYTLAYKLASEHGQTDPKPFVQAEFLSGWLALRFLDKPDVALPHFQALYDNATTPVTKSRGAYWLGRSYEALNDKGAAEQAYEDAAAFNTTYYGQLATTRLYAEPTLTAKVDPAFPESARRVFMGRDHIKAIIRLYDIGEMDRARSFFHAACDHATERGEFVILTEVALHMHRPDLGIQAVKAANQKNMLVENGGFPLLTIHAPSPPESAFTHALIRQESMFNPEAASGVGARGLMQLMPRTAKDVARKMGMRYKESELDDPEYNVQLGTNFVEEQIERFNGSYILALAGYNAGPGRVHEWLGKFGDPRNPDIDPVDWVELIPIQETRNYVQRIIESLQIYRSKIAGGQAPLLILKDLKR